MSGKANGGFARAAALTPERRKEVATEAAKARWARNGPAKSVSVSLTDGQMTVLDSMVATGLFPHRQDVLRFLIAQCAMNYPNTVGK